MLDTNSMLKLLLDAEQLKLQKKNSTATRFGTIADLIQNATPAARPAMIQALAGAGFDPNVLSQYANATPESIQSVRTRKVAEGSDRVDSGQVAAANLAGKSTGELAGDNLLTDFIATRGGPNGADAFEQLISRLTTGMTRYQARRDNTLAESYPQQAITQGELYRENVAMTPEESAAIQLGNRNAATSEASVSVQDFAAKDRSEQWKAELAMQNRLMELRSKAATGGLTPSEMLEALKLQRDLQGMLLSGPMSQGNQSLIQKGIGVSSGLLNQNPFGIQFTPADILGTSARTASESRKSKKITP